VARTLKDARLESREARNRLAARPKPYWRTLRPGKLHLGYRRRRKSAPGFWVVRTYIGIASVAPGKSPYRIETLPGVADDFEDANGTTVFDFAQAQDKALAPNNAAKGTHAGPFMVADAMDLYFEFLAADGRTRAAIEDARGRDRAFIRPRLGHLQLIDLSAEELRRWRDSIAKAAPRRRTRPGEKQKHGAAAEDDDRRRARRASANRTWTVLRAALNLSFERDKVDSDKAWRKVKPFKKVDKARVRYLSLAEAKRLINASDSDFRPLLHAALLTGGRYGSVAQLVASDFNADAGTVRMRTRKGDGTEKVYHVHLSEEGWRFFEQVCAGRRGDERLFKKDDGSAWGKSDQIRRVEEASVRAKISPPVNFHVTRHTWASHAVMNGTPLIVVAQNLGHSDTRMCEKYYQHLAPSYVAQAIRAGAPMFGTVRPSKVVALGKR
jgi:integrase